MQRGRVFLRFLWVMVFSVSFSAGCRDRQEDIQLEEAYFEEREDPDTSLEEEREGQVSGRIDEGNVEQADESLEKENEGQKSKGKEDIYVDVCGQVAHPGVYQLPNGSRVFEAIERAGGMTGQAEAAAVNQAKELSDAEQVYVPSVTEIERNPAFLQAQETKENERGTAGKVNINTAGKEELMTLTGIGEVKADAIIRYRQEKGNFQKPEDLKKIEGIKDGVYQKVKDQITV